MPSVGMQSLDMPLRLKGADLEFTTSSPWVLAGSERDLQDRFVLFHHRQRRCGRCCIELQRTTRRLGAVEDRIGHFFDIDAFLAQQIKPEFSR